MASKYSRAVGVGSLVKPYCHFHMYVCKCCHSILIHVFGLFKVLENSELALHDLDMEKATKTRQSGTKMWTMRERKWKSILFIDVVI